MATDTTKKTTLLLVEDDPFMVDLLANEFTNAGFALVLAKTGKEGVEKFLEAKPDLILLDLILPDQNGLEALRQIRQDPYGASVRVIVLSNLSDDGNIDEAKKLGVKEYLVKANFDLSEILERVKTVLAQ